MATIAASRRRPLSDWIGFATFSALAIAIWRGAPSLALLLLPVIVHELLIAASFLWRARPRRRLDGWLPSAVGYATSFVMLVFIRVASTWHPEWIARSSSEWLTAFGALLWLAGSVIGLWALWFLRRSFSLAPEARALVTSGPYALARHPVYSSYLLSYGGIWLSHLTPAFTLALAAWLALLFARVRYEEQVLGGAFPEYAAYRERVGAFAPRLMPHK